MRPGAGGREDCQGGAEEEERGAKQCRSRDAVPHVKSSRLKPVACAYGGRMTVFPREPYGNDDPRRAACAPLCGKSQGRRGIQSGEKVNFW